LSNIKDVRASQALLELTHDSDPEVVEWSLIGLRQFDGGSSISDRLSQLVDDPRQQISDEAIYGLALRRDGRAFQPLMNALYRRNVEFDLIDAAGNLGDVRALPRLNQLYEEWREDPPQVLRNAIYKLGLKQ
jgi:hypothetical protein